jgi:hypothetical protein
LRPSAVTIPLQIDCKQLLNQRNAKDGIITGERVIFSTLFLTSGKIHPFPKLQLWKRMML